MNPRDLPSFEPPLDLTPVPARELLREVIAEVAPDELVMLDGLDDLDDDAFTEALAERPRREPLGIGLPELIALVTPVVWFAVQKIAERAAENAVDGSMRKAGQWWRRRRAKGPLEIEALSAERIESVEKDIVAEALLIGLDEAAAERLAGAVSKRLKRGGAESEPGDAASDDAPRE